ncbi:hypothetical protein N9522_07185 [Candidatus Thioglobus sp.]|nr:hypothetical protein [Candidatus Thioglobus sp.]MDB4058116.1 hypothetical protein [Candidatus Thioglobus sp.]
MNKLFLLLALLLSSISLQASAAACPVAQDGDCAQPDEYIVTMLKLELCTGAPASLVNTTAALSSYDVTCTGAVTVGTGSLTFDITSVAAGQAIATFASTTGLPIGTTFTHIKPTLSREIKMRGSVTIAAGSDYKGICSTDSAATAGSGNKYERMLAGKTSGTATLQTFYIGTDAGEATTRGTASQNAVSSTSYRICTAQNCSSSIGTGEGGANGSSNKWLPFDSLYGIAIEDVASTDTDFSLIYPLSEPYTVGPTAPKIDIAFGSKGSLNAISKGAATCAMTPYYVKSKMTITD